MSDFKRVLITGGAGFIGARAYNEIYSARERAERGLSLVIYGDGTQTRDFVHASDVVDVLVRVLKDENAEGQVFNVGFGRPVSVNELAKSVLNLVGSNLGMIYEKPRKGDLKHSFADVSKARRLLGYGPKVRLEDGLRTVFGLATTASHESQRFLPQD